MCAGAIGNDKYTRLLAFVDPENIPSIKTLERAGFQRGEYRKEFYERGCQPGVKRDLQGFFLERPGVGGQEKGDEGK